MLMLFFCNFLFCASVCVKITNKNESHPMCWRNTEPYRFPFHHSNHCGHTYIHKETEALLCLAIVAHTPGNRCASILCVVYFLNCCRRLDLAHL
jgi:hypothetical protein